LILEKIYLKPKLLLPVFHKKILALYRINVDTLCNFVLTNHSNHRESTMESVVDTGIDWEKYAICYDRLLDLKPYTSMLEEVVTMVCKNKITKCIHIDSIKCQYFFMKNR
jgi:hypothetical protein